MAGSPRTVRQCADRTPTHTTCTTCGRQPPMESTTCGRQPRLTDQVVTATCRVAHHSSVEAVGGACSAAARVCHPHRGMAPHHGSRSILDAAALAADRRCDVFVGVDCFARGTPYIRWDPGCGTALCPPPLPTTAQPHYLRDPSSSLTRYSAGPGCAPACAAARTAGLSLALFAPGWSIECGGAKCAAEDASAAAAADEEFWRALGIERLFRGGGGAS